MQRRAAVVASAVLLALAAPVPSPAAATPPVPNTTRFYWFGNYQIAKVWALGATGQGVTVAVLDSGVQATEPELRGVVLPGTDFAGGDGRTDTDRPDGHGSAMARYIAAQGGGKWDITGIAPNAKILPVTVNNEFAAHDDGSSFAQGIRYAAGHGAKIINLSQGSVGACPAALGAAVRDALGAGAVVVASAGNDGAGANESLFPANCPGVVAVGAVDGTKHPWPQSQRQPYVDVAAPGVQMFNENLAGDSGTSNGTSEAAALASGAIALVWSKFARLSGRQVVARLLATVTDDAAQPGRDTATGYGIIRPYNAITTSVPADAPNPIFDEISTSTAPSPSAVPSNPRSSSADVPTSAPGSAGTSGVGPAAQSSGSGHGPLIAAAIAAAVVATLIAVVVLARRRRRPPPYQPRPW